MNKNREIPFFTFENSPTQLREEWKNQISQVIEAGVFVQGPQVRKFEENWRRYIGCQYAIGVSNGQDALILALRALSVGQGDEVLVPAHTFIATHNAILAVGATIRSVDVGEDGLFDATKLAYLNNIPKAIIVVHMHGKICNMEKILEWANSHGVKVVEDCSQAHGASLRGIKAGNFGDIGVFSLYPTKNLGAIGDAGVIVTNNEIYYDEIRSLSNYGSSLDSKYNHTKFGINNRLDEIQASVLNVNILYLEEWNLARKALARIYFEELAGTGISILQNYDEDHVWHHFCILHPNRNILRAHLASCGVSTEVHYPNVAAKEVETYLGTEVSDYPIAQSIADSILSLPMHPWLSERDAREVGKVIREFEQKQIERIRNGI